MLLITSRETRRWVIPKGWPIKGLTPELTATREAFEEAGVIGRPPSQAIGAYSYEKRLRSGRAQSVQVEVFPLEVVEEAERWVEQGQREKRWSPPEVAINLVDEPELRQLIRRFAEVGVDGADGRSRDCGGESSEDTSPSD